MGPGDSVLSSLLAPALGSKGLILVDSGNFAHKDMSLYKKQIENFKKKYPALELPFISFEKDLDKMLSYVNGNYFYNGLSL